MTYNELKDQVAHLGFERTVEEDALFYSAAQRALRTLFTDRGELASRRIHVTAPRVNRVHGRIRHCGGATEEVVLTGTAFSFLPHGDGACSIIGRSTLTRVEFLAANGLVKARIPSGSATLRFEGETDYAISSLASFDGNYDVSLEGVIEYSERRQIDLYDYVGDLRALAALPRLSSGETATDIRPMGRRLELPFFFDGELIIDYYRLPRSISRTEGEIDVPSETEHLLPLLTAAYVWLDDDADKSQYYMALYRDGMASAIRASRLDGVKEYVTNGWA